jgi:16S rRNA (guanine527-N7)-methyltransferase
MTGMASDPPTLPELVARYHLGPGPAAALGVVDDHLSSDPHAPTSARDRARSLERHIADSLVGLELAPVARARAIADLGSGAGLPGLVLAAAIPEATVHAVESTQRKCSWIASLATAAGLGNVEVVCRRAEEWPRGLEAHDLVVARALAAQPVVLEYAAPLLAVGGHLVEWRGRRSAEDEARGDEAAAELGMERVEVRTVKPFPSAEARHLHVFRKVGPTPSRFPRRPGLAVRRPLGGRPTRPGR